MSYENLEHLTVSTRGNVTNAQVPKWQKAIDTEGYAVIPVYHNVKKGKDDIKSMVVRKVLGKIYPTLYFAHATEESGQIFLIVSDKKKVFNAQKWEYGTHVTEAVE